MPTLLRIEGFRFFFYSSERQEPPHVHVEKGDGEAKLWLQPVELVYSSAHPGRAAARTRTDVPVPSSLRGAVE
jgi:uncharacterized protein DUF4160